ncbi:MAG: hypothetical protein JNL94_03610 [Planctomycetes bacterium]|nr:hypothetical protein [Planctomycetota bacterium]
MRFSRVRWFAAPAIAFVGCAVAPTLPQPAQDKSLVAQGRIAYAVYNEHALLVSNPIEELAREMKRRDETPEARPFTDVYVIAHGWNYTYSESSSRYAVYIADLQSRFLDGVKANDPNYEPFFIFVIWPSVSRPFFTVFDSVLPYRAADAVAPAVELADGVVHFVSTWQESNDAFNTALGHKFPAYYEGQSYDSIPVADYAGDSRRLGRDAPLSVVLVELMRRSQAAKEKPRLHLIGHSYGCKVVAQAGLEAARRNAIEHGAKTFDEARSHPSFDSMLLFDAAMHPTELRYPLGLVPLRTSVGRAWRNVRDEPLNAPLEAWSETAESLENAWFGMNNQVRVLGNDEVADLLHTVERKAVVFTNTDAANGFWFDISELPLQRAGLQALDPMSSPSLRAARGRMDEIARTGGGEHPAPPRPEDLEPRNVALNVASSFVGGVDSTARATIRVGWIAGVSVVQWALEKVTTTVWDLGRVVAEPYRDEQGNVATDSGRAIVNVVKFVVPVNMLCCRDSEDLGILRHSRPALGRTGIVGYELGRPDFDLTPWSITDFRTPWTSNYVDDAQAISTERVMAGTASISSPLWFSGTPTDRDLFLSIDASTIFHRTMWNPLNWFVGAHNELRSMDDVEGVSPADRTMILSYAFTRRRPALTPAPSPGP